MADENESETPSTKKSILVELIGSLWKGFLEKFLLPLVLAALAGGFAVWQQKTEAKAADKTYQAVKELLSKDLTKNLEAIRKNLNEQNDDIQTLKTAVLSLKMELMIEQELRKAGDKARRAPKLTPIEKGSAAATQPAPDPDAPFKLLKAKAAKRASVPAFKQRPLPKKLTAD